MNRPPDPHPLDFDWRFTPQTVASLVRLISPGKRVLALGTPSIARHLDQNCRPVTLIDRQPYQGVKDHRCLDLNAENSIRTELYDVAVIDPPWYPSEVCKWIVWAAQCLTVGGSIFVSVWPEETRPGGMKEMEDIFVWLSGWANVRNVDLPIEYQIPPFEEIAVLNSAEGILSTSPRRGRLIAVEPFRKYSMSSPPSLGPSWVRLVFNDYQLAVKKKRAFGPTSLSGHPKAFGWTWPYVSLRAPGRELIDLWSSANEVARVSNPEPLLEALRQLGTSDNPTAINSILDLIPELADWKLPKPPYQRFFEWQHH